MSLEQLFGFVDQYGLFAVVVIAMVLVFLISAPVLLLAQRLRIAAATKDMEAKAANRLAEAGTIETENKTRSRMDDIAFQALREKSDKDQEYILLQKELLDISLEFAERRATANEREKSLKEFLDDRERRLSATEKLLGEAQKQLNDSRIALEQVKGELELARVTRQKDKELADANSNSAKERVVYLEELNERLKEENRLLREQNTSLTKRLDEIEAKLEAASKLAEEATTHQQTISTEVTALTERMNNGTHEIEAVIVESAAANGEYAGAD